MAHSHFRQDRNTYGFGPGRLLSLPCPKNRFQSLTPVQGDADPDDSELDDNDLDDRSKDLLDCLTLTVSYSSPKLANGSPKLSYGRHTLYSHAERLPSSCSTNLDDKYHRWWNEREVDINVLPISSDYSYVQDTDGFSTGEISLVLDEASRMATFTHGGLKRRIQLDRRVEVWELRQIPHLNEYEYGPRLRV
ncbi:hypothetical protein M430DRAFT_38394 [Amorphotheca resinae ATCC 22711]|uniref:Uncharacterized protein n=1 Tax=Amorphotheca resinae ATCC 22711 TaxID=857342 RepID=A0A2T3BE86_AMORE|nr:hypothetical protein M430DRAFT_38394 [Amorphotheca resinae ATCC 22711]PSS27643.1 hypothetical protein M430DRAFT_38394 [Amorphotheca resinae ATCC 22711]